MSKLLSTVFLSLAPIAAIAADSAQIVLEKHGLRSVNGMWYPVVDAQISDRIGAVERLERRIKDLQKQVDQLLDHNERQKAQLAALNAAQIVLKDARGAAKGGSPEQKRLDEQIKQQGAAIDQLKNAVVPADKLGGTAPLKGAAMELVGVRAELTLQLAMLRRLLEGATAVHEKLRNDSDVTAALAALEPPGQLAPVRSYTNEQRSLSRAEKLVFNDDLPLYREGKQLRVTGIANEELPITFSHFDRNEPTVITHTMAESLGLTIDGREAKELRLDGKYNVQATMTQLSQLRFGRHILRNIPVYVLSPEHEYLGARIGRAGFQGLRQQVMPERLLLHLEPASEAKTQ